MEEKHNDDDVMEDIPTLRQPVKEVKATLTPLGEAFDRRCELEALVAERDSAAYLDCNKEAIFKWLGDIAARIRALKGGGK
jgi:hypothetical protein